ncbi:ubiquitin thioesterase OTUB1 [Vairimorpha necatrix]|uniref:ubiquitinyl hydrolase 1 n=1 Tax=Vairimorpha necatrix TaxID=6039 RepID=A0AAX4JC62_9MICR
MEKSSAVSGKLQITNHEFYSDKLKSLSSYREIPRDGNCMYLSISIKILEFFRSKKDQIYKWETFTTSLKSYCTKLNIEEFVYIDNLETFSDLINNNTKIEDIDLYTWYEILYIFRLAISTHMRLNSEEYQPYIVDMSVEKYCKNCIEPLFMEAGYIEIGALVNIMPINVKMYDTTEESNKYRIYGENEEFIEILHTPNHFEPVY